MSHLGGPIKTTQSFMDRIFTTVIANHFLNGEDAFRAKVVWVFSTSVGGIALIILVGLMLAEGSVPVRRLGTVVLACSLLLVSVLIRYAKQLISVSSYVVCMTIIMMFYVDFNNASVLGPTSVLWVVPFTLMALLFSGKRLWLMVALTLSLFAFNILALTKGWLPEPIIDLETGHFAQAAFVLASIIIVMISTRGVTKLASAHLSALNIEIKNKQARIEKMSDLKREAESATLSKSMFLSTMSHELRTPLNSVIGNSQLLTRAQLPSKHQEQVKDISIAANLLLVLINDILDFSKLEANQLHFIEKDYALDQQLTDLTRMMQPRLKPGVNMTLSLPQQPIYIHGDENRLAQVIMNLLSNSIKFTSEGHIQVSLDVNPDNHIIIAVRDTGMGIKEEDVDRLFTRFTQVSNDSAMNMEGTGLGLAISMGIVKQMSGDIQVQSTAGEGSCFSVILPGRQIQEVALKSGDEQGTLERHLIQTCAFLVVDDMPMNCMVLDSMLVDLGALNVVAVNSGDQALAFIEKNMQTSMVLMDMRMPGMSGVEAAIAIRNIGYQGKIIAVTANASEQDRAACLDAGMDEFIAKPVAIDALEKVLIKLINVPDPITGPDFI